MKLDEINTIENIRYSWRKGVLFYRIEKNYINTGECFLIAKVPIWRKNAEEITIHMTKGLELGRMMQW
jgi:hypothetical protein